MQSRKSYVLITPPTLFWSQIRSSISRSLMSNNKRRTLFSVRVQLEHRKFSIHQWGDHSSQTKNMCTFQNWRHPQKYQQPAEDSYLLILLFQVPSIVSYSFKRYKLKKNNQKTQLIPQKLPPYLNVSGPHQKDYLRNFFLDFSVAQAWTQNKWRHITNSEKH